MLPPRGAQLINRVHLLAGGTKAAVYRVHLERDRAQVELAAGLGDRGGMQLRVDVGHEAEPGRVMREERQQVLDRLDPGRLYSANSRAAVTPSASRSASSRAGTGSPLAANTSRQPESRPKSAAHRNHAGETVLSLGTCMWASTTTRPSIIGAG